MPFSVQFLGPLLLAVLLSYTSLVFASCRKYVAVHSIIQSPNMVQTFDDEGGFREIKAHTYDINGCNPHERLKTGHQYVGNYTFIGHSSNTSTNDCVVENSDGKMIFRSFQAVEVSVNGWKFSPEFDIDDVDAQINATEEDAWKESVAVLGMDDDNIVTPTIKLHNSTILKTTDVMVPKAATDAMGLTVGEVVVTGVEYAATELVNCPFGRDNELSKKCRVSVRFTAPVDKVIIMYALSQKSKNDPKAAAFLSEFLMGCGCRCSKVEAGRRMITVKVPGTSNQCIYKETSGRRTLCDMEGSLWCDRVEATEYVGASTATLSLDDATIPCSGHPGERAEVISSFSPRNDFVESVL